MNNNSHLCYKFDCTIRLQQLQSLHSLMRTLHLLKRCKKTNNLHILKRNTKSYLIYFYKSGKSNTLHRSTAMQQTSFSISIQFPVVIPKNSQCFQSFTKFFKTHQNEQQLCFNTSVYEKVITSTSAESSFLFHVPCLSGQNFVIYAKNFQASILFECAAFLACCCTFAVIIFLDAVSAAFILPDPIQKESPKQLLG